MSQRRIVMNVPREGISTGRRNTTYETEGYVGQSCKDASRFLREKMGTVLDDRETAEAHMTEEGVERVQDGG